MCAVNSPLSLSLSRSSSGKSTFYLSFSFAVQFTWSNQRVYSTLNRCRVKRQQPVKHNQASFSTHFDCLAVHRRIMKQVFFSLFILFHPSKRSTEAQIRVKERETLVPFVNNCSLLSLPGPINFLHSGSCVIGHLSPFAFGLVLVLAITHSCPWHSQDRRRRRRVRVFSRGDYQLVLSLFRSTAVEETCQSRLTTLRPYSPPPSSASPIAISRYFEQWCTCLMHFYWRLVSFFNWYRVSSAQLSLPLSPCLFLPASFSRSMIPKEWLSLSLACSFFKRTIN